HSAEPEICTPSLHDALPICCMQLVCCFRVNWSNTYRYRLGELRGWLSNQQRNAEPHCGTRVFVDGKQLEQFATGIFSHLLRWNRCDHRSIASGCFFSYGKL